MQLALVQTAENVAPTKDVAASNRNGFWGRMRAEHIALIFTGMAGFLIFTGQSYYDRLFRDFALKPGILAISQPELVTKGVVCTIYALFQVIRDNWLKWLGSGTFGLVLAAIIALIAWKWAPLRHLIEKRMPNIQAFNHKWTRVFFWCLGFLFSLTGLLAGDQGGELDAKAMQAARQKTNICYLVDGKLHRGVILAQDQVRTILVQKSITSILKNEQISHVGDCPSR